MASPGGDVNRADRFGERCLVVGCCRLRPARNVCGLVWCFIAAGAATATVAVVAIVVAVTCVATAPTGSLKRTDRGVSTFDLMKEGMERVERVGAVGG